MKNERMKIRLFYLTALVLAACGTTDNKNEAENYPTYDTTEQTDHINDSSGRNMNTEGELRHNRDEQD